MSRLYTALLYVATLLTLVVYASPFPPGLEPRDNDVCKSGLYEELSFVSAYPVVQSCCIAHHPVSYT